MNSVRSFLSHYSRLSEGLVFLRTTTTLSERFLFILLLLSSCFLYLIALNSGQAFFLVHRFHDVL